MKRHKLQRIKHNSDVYIIPLLSLEVRDSMKRASVVPNKKRYIRRAKKQELKTLLEKGE